MCWVAHQLGLSLMIEGLCLEPRIIDYQVLTLRGGRGTSAPGPLRQRAARLTTYRELVRKRRNNIPIRPAREGRIAT